MDFKNWFQKKASKPLPNIKIVLKLLLKTPKNANPIKHLYLILQQANIQTLQKIQNKNTWEIIGTQDLTSKDDINHVKFILNTPILTASEPLQKINDLLRTLKKYIEHYYNHNEIIKAKLTAYYTSGENEVEKIVNKNYPYQPGINDDDEYRGNDNNDPPMAPSPSPMPTGIANQTPYALTAGKITPGKII